MITIQCTSSNGLSFFLGGGGGGWGAQMFMFPVRELIINDLENGFI